MPTGYGSQLSEAKPGICTKLYALELIWPESIVQLLAER